MTPCPACGARRFTACATHGAWCVPCTKAMSCPSCAAPREGGSVLVDLLVPASILALGWLALVVL